MYLLCMCVFNRKSSIIIAADESTISWGPSPTFGELVRPQASLHSTLMMFRLSELEKKMTEMRV